MPQTLFTNVKIFDGTGQSAGLEEVLVQGNRIRSASKGRKKLPRDGGGATLMPGLVNSHCHMSYTGPESMDNIPVEEHMLLTMRQAAAE